MINEADILLLHDFSIRDFGGATGIRDRNMLLSAISRPFQTFDGQDLYCGPLEKAAALGESLIINHPFIDGNKRTALLAMLAFLMENDLEISVGHAEIYNFIISMSTGEKKFSDILQWLNNNLIR